MGSGCRTLVSLLSLAERAFADEIDMTKVKVCTRSVLAARIHKTHGIPLEDSQKIVQFVIEAMCRAIENGESLKVSRFGSFLPRDKAERLGRNPNTGVPAVITARKVLSFRASNSLKARIRDAAEQ